jgi:hypothetical protein
VHGLAAAPAVPSLIALLLFPEINWRSHWVAADALIDTGPTGRAALAQLAPCLEEHLRRYVEQQTRDLIH